MPNYGAGTCHVLMQPRCLPADAVAGHLEPMRPYLAAACAALMACNSDGPSGPPFGPDAVVYRLRPQLINYIYDDSATAGLVLHLEWMSDTTFFGTNCFGFTPNGVGDTTGTFQFYSTGGNQGFVLQNINGVLDTVVGLFLTGNEGTNGSYVRRSSGQVLLTWADGGQQTRYFDPQANIRFIGDTLRSTADLRYNGDSVRAQWDVSWIVGNCN